MIIRRASKNDIDAIWEILQSVISGGDTFVFDPTTPKTEMLDYWFKEGTFIFVAETNQSVVGTYIYRQNQPGLGSHIANASYAVHPDFRGNGIGKTMCKHSLQSAKEDGFTAMQFNIVVSSNSSAVHLWKNLGFEIIGEIPDAFNHRELGLTNAFIMYRKL